MNRRMFLHRGGATLAGLCLARLAPAETRILARPVTDGGPLSAPSRGRIRVAFALADHATVIDFAGPWEVFQDVHLPGGGGMAARMPFELYTVARTTDPITATAGLRVVPDYAFADAPRPHVVVVPALRGNPELHAWLRAMAPDSDLVMSVCTGAFQVARAGLLDGLTATTHHDFYDEFAGQFPGVRLVRDVRFVENRGIATAGGLTSGIDLALRTVERYFGRDVARHTADYMEYTGDNWQVDAAA